MELTVLIDVAGLSDPVIVLLRLTLLAKMLVACRKAGGQLTWHCKVVSLMTAPKVFEKAFGVAAEALLGNQCPTSYCNLFSNCLSFQGLKNWLYTVSRVSQTLAAPYMFVEGISAHSVWEILDQVLQSVDFTSHGHAALAERPNSAHLNSTELTSTKLIMLLGDIPECLSLRRQHAGALTDHMAAQLSATTLKKLKQPGTSLTWCTSIETEGSMQAATINAKLHSNQDYFRQDNPYDLSHSYIIQVIDSQKVIAAKLQRDVSIILQVPLGHSSTDEESSAFPLTMLDADELALQMDAIMLPDGDGIADDHKTDHSMSNSFARQQHSAM